MLLKLNINNYADKKQNFEADCVDKDVDDSKRGIVSDQNCCSCLEKCSKHSILKCCMIYITTSVSKDLYQMKLQSLWMQIQVVGGFVGTVPYQFQPIAVL